MLDHELEHEELAQLTLRVRGVHLGVRTVAPDLRQSLLVGTVRVLAEFFPERFLRALGFRWGLAVACALQVRNERAVRREVRVAPDRGREVRVRARRERVVPDERRRIGGFRERPQHGGVHRPRDARPGGRVEEGLELFARRVLGDLEPGDGRRLPELVHVAGGGLRVDAPDQRDVHLLEQGRDGFVRFHHEHLDQGVGERVVLGVRIDDAPVLVELELDFGEVEVDHPRFAPTRLDEARERVHIPDGLDELVRVGGVGLGVFLCFFEIAVDERLRLKVGHALARFDQRLTERARADVARSVVADDRGLRVAEDPFLEGADPVGEDLGEHGDHETREVHGVSAFLRFLVERGVLLDVVRDVRDVDPELPAAVVELLDVDRVVVVLGIGGIDGADELVCQILAHVEGSDTLALVEIHLLVESLGRCPRKLNTRFRELKIRERVRRDDGLGLDIGLPSFAQHFRDDPLREPTLLGIVDDLEDDLRPDLHVLGVRVLEDHGAGEFAPVGVCEPTPVLFRHLPGEDCSFP